MKPAISTPHPDPLSDHELAQRIAAGDTAAFESVMRRHNRALFRIARAILRDDAEAEDALQEAYIRAYRTIGEFRGEARLSTWLGRIVANEGIARLRKSTRRAEIIPMQSAATVDDFETVSDTAMQDGPEFSARRAELRKLIEAQIDALPEAYRPVFMLRAVEELTVEETAAVLQIPPATVRSRFFRARSLLREKLASQIDVACEDAFAFAGERCDRIVAGVLARIAGDAGEAR